MTDSVGQRIARKLAEKAHEAYRLKHPEMKVVPWAETTEGVREIGTERVECVLAELAHPDERLENLSFLANQYKAERDDACNTLEKLRAELARERDAGWVSVKERLPEIEKTVIVYLPAYKAQWVYWRADNESPPGWAWTDGEYFHPTDAITHWRELPAPPACGSSEAKGGDSR